MIEPRIDLKLRASEQQLYSLIKEIKRLRDTKQFASPFGIKTFLDIIENSCKSVQEFISRLKSQSVSQDIRKANPERAIQRHCLLINYLNQFLSILDGSDIESVLPQVVQPFRRLIKDLFPKAEIILVSTCELNYSVFDVMQYFRELSVSGETGNIERLLQVPPNTPSHLFIISIPRTDQKNVLLHSVLSHEIGHTIYDEFKIQSNLTPVEIDAQYLDLIVQYIKGNKEINVSTEIVELEVRSKISQEVTTVVTEWKKELFSDSIGTILFGPAFLYALIHFGNAIDVLDGGAKSHPPLRLRLRLVFKILHKRFRNLLIVPQIKDLLSYWDNLSKEKCAPTDPILYGAVKSIEKESILEEIIEKSEETIKMFSTNLIYDQNKYDQDVNLMSCSLVAGILPIEFLKKDKDGTPKGFIPSNMISIINAGWVVYLYKMDEFKKLLSKSIRENDSLCFERLNEVLVKSLELHDIKLGVYKTKL